MSEPHFQTIGFSAAYVEQLQARVRELEVENRLQQALMRTESEWIKKLEAALRELVEALDQNRDAMHHLGDEHPIIARARSLLPTESAEATAERWEAEEAGLPVVIPTEESK